jgi:hypothetical protein
MNEPLDRELLNACIVYADSLCIARIIRRDAQTATARARAAALTYEAHELHERAPAPVAELLDCIAKILEIDETVADPNEVLQRAGVLP